MKKLLMLLSIFFLSLTKTKATNTLIVEGRIWEYVETYENVFTGEHSWQFSKFGFTESIIKFGKEYHQWTLIQKEKYHLDGNDKDGNLEIETSHYNTPVALIREEEGVIYMLLESPTVKTFDSNTLIITERDVLNGEEAILYDFNVASGARFEMMYKSSFLTDCLVKDVSEVEVNGTMLRAYSIITDYEYPDLRPEDNPNYYITCVETVGNIGEGTLTSIYTNAYVPVPTNGEIYHQGFNALYSANGEVIFKGMDVSKPSIINEAIHDYRNPSIKQLFDLHGREVSNPLPGSIYIRNGKKFVAK